MNMDMIHGNNTFKVLEVNVAAGEKMPRHFATSDAYVIAEQGEASLSLLDREITLRKGISVHIPANEPHSLAVTENFKSFVVLAADAEIEFTNH